MTKDDDNDVRSRSKDESFDKNNLISNENPEINKAKSTKHMVGNLSAQENKITLNDEKKKYLDSR